MKLVWSQHLDLQHWWPEQGGGGGAAGVVHTEVAASLLQPENSNYYVLNIGEAAEMNDA